MTSNQSGWCQVHCTDDLNCMQGSCLPAIHFESYTFGKRRNFVLRLNTDSTSITFDVLSCESSAIRPLTIESVFVSAVDGISFRKIGYVCYLIRIPCTYPLFLIFVVLVLVEDVVLSRWIKVEQRVVTAITKQVPALWIIYVLAGK